MKSIRFKLWTGMMMLIIIVLILLWFFQIVFLESFYTNIRIAEIKKETGRIAVELFKRDQIEDLNELEAYAFKNNLNMEILDRNGNVIYTTQSMMGAGGQMPMMRNAARIEVYKNALSGSETTATLTHPHFGYPFMLIGLPIKKSQTVSGALMITLPLAPVKETASILKRQLFYISLILLAASLVISYFISRNFTLPILEIKKASETMASGDYKARVQIYRQDELGKLALAINGLGQKLSKIEELRRELIANVSHDLRTPLSLIQGYAETIKDVSGSFPEKRDKQLGIIIEETERLSRMVDDILNLSQIQSGYIELNKSCFSMEESLEAIIRRYDVLCEKTGIQIIHQSSENSFVYADQVRVEQVLYNLINNAFNHTSSGGMISVRAVELSQSVRVEVSDTGRGIPEEDIPHIWDRYYKASKTDGKKAVGTGLGLAIVKGVLEAHHAPFGVDSKENEGTSFWFELKKPE